MNKDFVTIGQLSKITKERYSTLKYYTEIGILPFVQIDKKLRRKYQLVNSIQRIILIKKLKQDRHLSIKDIVSLINSH